MRIKQKDENYANSRCVPDSSIYSKNPRFKIQKLLRSRMNQLNTKCLLMKSFESLTPQSQAIPNKNQLNAHSRDKKNHRYSEPIGNNHDNKRTQKTQFSNKTQTIDIIKQQISKTLSKDLLSLKNNVNQPTLTMKTKNSLKIKLFQNKRRSWTINYNECCSLAQSKCQQQLLLKPHKQSLNITPKLCVYQGKNKTIAPLIYFLKKKQISERCLQPLQIPHRIIRKKVRNIYNSPQNKYQYHSQRTKGKTIEESRESLYSPWEMGQREANDPEISDIFY